MTKIKNKIKLDHYEDTSSLDLTIKPNDGHKRTEAKAAEIDEIAKTLNNNRTPERILRNAMLAVQYKMEHYVNDDNMSMEHICTIKDFATDFLDVLGIKKSAFADFIEIDMSNLNKYYKTERRFNTDLAMKFAYFFHTPAELWLKVQIKNELLELQKAKEASEKYSKYDYERALQIN